MRDVLVTGGAGFIGSNFVRLLLAGPVERLVVLDKLTYAGSRENLADVLADPRLVFVEGDIAETATVVGLFERHAFKTVVNFAAESHVDRSIDSPRVFVETNIGGTFELLEASRAHHATLDAEGQRAFRFLHVSTDEVFGSLGAEGLFTEDTPYAPNSPYSASKAAADHLVRAFHHTYGLPTLLTNCSNNYGPFQFPEKLIPLMILNALEGKPLPIYGDGRHVRDWLYVEDHCHGIVQVLERGRVGASYNIGAENERPNIEVVDTICAVLDRLHPAAGNPAVADKIGSYAELKTHVPDRAGHDRRYAIDPSRMRDELDWQPRHDFASGIEATVRWYLDHRDWCEKIQAESRYHRQRLGLDGPSTKS